MRTQALTFKHHRGTDKGVPPPLMHTATSHTFAPKVCTQGESSEPQGGGAFADWLGAAFLLSPQILFCFGAAVALQGAGASIVHMLANN